MTDEQAKNYRKDCENARSTFEIPIIGKILTPICKLCLNYQMGKNWDPPTCKEYGKIPHKYIMAEEKDCQLYVNDPNSPFKKAVTDKDV